LHPDTDDADADAIVRSDLWIGSGFQPLIAQEDGICGGERSGGSGGALQELAAGKIFHHGMTSQVRNFERDQVGCTFVIAAPILSKRQCNGRTATSLKKTMSLSL
jgi:hypothetical protein